MQDLFSNHIDAVVTILITIIGFVVTYLMAKKNFADEIKKEKISLNAEAIKELPFDICKLMDHTMRAGEAAKEPFAEKYSDLLSRILAYGSRKAVEIAIHMQQSAYSIKNTENKKKQWEMLASLALLISQIKYDLTSEIIAPDSWFKMRLTDYEERKEDIINTINQLIKTLNLDKRFIIYQYKSK